MHGEITTLAYSFRSYIAGMDAERIEKYLVQFDSGHMATAMRMLQRVDFYDGMEVIRLARQLMDMIRDRNGGTLRGVYFCPMTTRTGDSAGSMTRVLRNLDAPDLRERNEMNTGMLRNIYHLAEFEDEEEPKLIVLLDHFIGTGSSIIKNWGILGQWQNDNHQYIVGALVAYEDAMEKIREETDSEVDIISGVTLPEDRRAFHADNHYFSDTEQDTIKKYCEMIVSNKRDQYGYKNSQSLVIFHDRAPNNALPVLHKKKPLVWTPLFPRYFS